MTVDLVSLGEICKEIYRYPTYYGIEYLNNGVPEVRGELITEDGTIDLDRQKWRFISETTSSKFPRTNLEEGDLIMSVRGTIGKVGIVPHELHGGNITANLIRISPNKQRVYERYLWMYMRSPEFLNSLDNESSSTTIKTIKAPNLKALLIPLPSLEKQKRIADILDRAEALRAKRRAALAQLDEITEAIFIEMFGDPVTNPKEWKKVGMPEVVVGKYGIKAGPFGSSLKKEEYTTSGYRIYGQEQVIAGRFDIGDYYISERKYQQLKACAVNEGDLLVSLVGSFGKVLVVPPGIEPGIINPRLLKITPNKNLLTSDFLTALLSLPAIQAEFERMAHGGTMGILNAGLLKQLQVILPPLDLQREFSHHVKAIENYKSAYEASLAELDELFFSLQYRAFRGEL